MTASQEWGATAYAVEPKGRPPFTITVSGRDRWAIEELMRAGERGCTPIDNPAPRWSGYVFNLRALGVPIETIHEQHHGPFAGSHARYVLQATVTPQAREAAE